MYNSIDKVIASIFSKFGKDILLNGSKFCAVLDDLSPEMTLERRIMKRLWYENMFDDIYNAVLDNRLLSRVEMLLTEAGFSEEWKNIVFEAFNLKNDTYVCSEIKYDNVNDIDKMIELGIQYRDNQKYGEALYWFLKAADQKSAKAHLLLGHLYHEKDWINKDYRKSYEHYKTAYSLYSSMDDMSDICKMYIGDCYYWGYGVAVDYRKAGSIYSSIISNIEAENCILNSKYRLYCLGVKEETEGNYLDAIEWYKKSYNKGFKLAEKSIHKWEKIIAIIKEWEKIKIDSNTSGLFGTFEQNEKKTEMYQKEIEEEIKSIPEKYFEMVANTILIYEEKDNINDNSVERIIYNVLKRKKIFEDEMGRELIVSLSNSEQYNEEYLKLISEKEKLNLIVENMEKNKILGKMRTDRKKKLAYLRRDLIIIGKAVESMKDILDVKETIKTNNNNTNIL